MAESKNKDIDLKKQTNKKSFKDYTYIIIIYESSNTSYTWHFMVNNFIFYHLE